MKERQKLDRRDTYTPADAPQVRGNCDHALNREETLSVHGLKTPSNTPDVDIQSGMTGQDLRVPVINMRNEPLMPTSPGKARRLLKHNRARVISSNPFTIQLLYATGETKQPVTLGIDAGYKHIGFSVVTEKRELISGEAVMRTDMPKLNVEKSMYRRGRRNRLWYRQPQFINRGNNSKGWFAPSIAHKLQTHIRLIEKLKKILPVSKVIIEVASFDQQKMKNPEISGIEYQQGELQGYEIREYLLEKFHRKCVYCRKTNVPMEIEHLTPRSRNGPDTVDNLAISCHECNQKKNNLTAEEFGYPEVRKRALKSLKDATFMNIVRWKLTQLTGSAYTFGYITKKNRISLGLDKSHANDAFVIAGGTTQARSTVFDVTQRRRNNRSLQINRKGFRPSIRRRRYPLQPGDVVEFGESRYGVVGVHSYGNYVIIMNGEKKMDVNIKKVKLVKYGKGLRFTTQFLPTLSHMVSLEGS
ncbi:RNA-guided endonuclease IscB [Ferroplasma sp. Type II]|uniref:RNA-guided endonuclease IscB n=1 Tax=Ferroplasma sp. Type II TaxID=261388 RepID=UPI0025C0B7C0|nr:RNA-guided endonuclease IscB [Ferroplasma sp. Type II]